MSYIISYVGAGGKTSSIYQDAAAFVNEGKKVMITTTTHMYVPKDRVFIDGREKSCEKLREEVAGREVEHCDYIERQRRAVLRALLRAHRRRDAAKRFQTFHTLAEQFFQPVIHQLVADGTAVPLQRALEQGCYFRVLQQ